MMVKAIATKTFRDLSANVMRDEGAEFEVEDGRLEEINSTKYGRLAVLVEPRPSHDDQSSQGDQSNQDQSNQETKPRRRRKER